MFAKQRLISTELPPISRARVCRVKGTLVCKRSVILNSSEPNSIDESHIDRNFSKDVKPTSSSSRPAPPPSLARAPADSPTIVVRHLPRVLLIHTGGTLGMQAEESYTLDSQGHLALREGTGGVYKKQEALRPGNLLGSILTLIPELKSLAHLDLKVLFNKDSSNVGPKDWIALAKTLDSVRDIYDAFLIIHGTDTMAFTAASLSLMLAGFRKPIVITGSQLPISLPRSDARQNLIDSLTCATAAFCPPHAQFIEVAICFGGKLLRGNRAQKINTQLYQAFDTPTYPHLANLGVEVEWNEDALLKPVGIYRPRFRLDSKVIRCAVIPGSDPRIAYGDLASRGVKGVILEVFGVGNMPSTAESGWLQWLKQQRENGIQIYLRSQSTLGPLKPEAYQSGSLALKLGVEAGPQMTVETAAVKMMLCLEYPDLPLGWPPLAGEM
jgi:L-asparaginase